MELIQSKEFHYLLLWNNPQAFTLFALHKLPAIVQSTTRLILTPHIEATSRCRYLGLSFGMYHGTSWPWRDRLLHWNMKTAFLAFRQWNNASDNTRSTITKSGKSCVYFSFLKLRMASSLWMWTRKRDLYGNEISVGDMSEIQRSRPLPCYTIIYTSLGCLWISS